jgi:hypothetical protein
MAGNGDERHDPDRGEPEHRGREQRERDLHLWDRELGGYGNWASGDPDPHQLPGPEPSRRTKKIYFAMMGTCIGLCAIAWVVVSRYSTVAAVAMSAVALVIPPFAAIIANAASATDRRR